MPPRGLIFRLTRSKSTSHRYRFAAMTIHSASSSLAAIKVDSAPPREPDKATQAEEKRLEKAASAARLTPTEQICASHAAHLTDVRNDNERLRADNMKLRRRLESLEPEHAALRQASRTNSLTDVLGFSISGIGACAISAGSIGFVASHSVCLSCSGAAAVLLGYFMLIYVKFCCWPKPPNGSS
jgi:hypothetical protein